MTNRNPESRAGSSGYDFPPLDVSVRSDSPSSLVVEVRGELDVVTGPMLHQHLERYNSPGQAGDRPQRIVYHLSELEFMDASGLAALLSAMEGHDHTIAVRQPSPLVRRILEVVGMDSMIEDANR